MNHNNELAKSKYQFKRVRIKTVNVMGRKIEIEVMCAFEVPNLGSFPLWAG